MKKEPTADMVLPEGSSTELNLGIGVNTQKILLILIGLE